MRQHSFGLHPRMRSTSLAFGMALVLIGCASQKEEASSTKGLTTTQLWTKNELTLCWDTKSVLESQLPGSVFGSPYRFGYGLPGQTGYATANAANFEAAIQKGIEANYTATDTIIHFAGFKDCEATPNADVKIIFDDNLPPGLMGVSNRVGMLQLPGGEQMFPGVTTPAVKISLANHMGGVPLRDGETVEDSVAQTALHELGHIVGLFHEHAHPLSTCHITPERADEKWKLGLLAMDSYIDHGTKYDPYSIMSYCKMMAYVNGDFKDPSLNAALVHGGLSDDDKAFLREIYSSVGQGDDSASGNGSAQIASNSNSASGFGGSQSAGFGTSASDASTSTSSSGFGGNEGQTVRAFSAPPAPQNQYGSYSGAFVRE